LVLEPWTLTEEAFFESALGTMVEVRAEGAGG
jgi:hypothetical protein